jgi:hypothetical protein
MSTRDRIKDMRNFYLRTSIYTIAFLVVLFIIGDSGGIYPENRTGYNGLLLIMFFLTVGPCIVDAVKYQRLLKKEDEKIKAVDELIHAILEVEDE